MMGRATTTTQNIKVDPLLVALFDLPVDTIKPILPQQKFSHTSSSVVTAAWGSRFAIPRNSGGVSTSPRIRANGHVEEDVDVETDNTSVLQGETISLTDEEFSDANSYFPIVQPAPYLINTGGCGVHDDDSPNNNNDSSATKKKKIRSTFKSLKKLVGRKGKSKFSGSSVTSSFDEDSGITSSPTVRSSDVSSNKDIPSSVIGVTTERTLHIEEQLPLLHSKIGRIRGHIQSLENTLTATRNELARTHQHLHSASMDLANLQRAALEADMGLSRLSQHHRQDTGRMSAFCFSEGEGSYRSMRSISSERLHYFTPTNSMIDGEESDLSACYTPRSTASFESFASINEGINQPFLEEAPAGRTVDVDATPLTKNSGTKKGRPRKLDAISGALTFDPRADTPSTAASTHEGSNADQVVRSDNEADDEDGNQRERKVAFYKQQSFIRTHDLGLSGGFDNSPLAPLNGNGLSKVVDALFETGLQSAMDESDRWTPVRDTEKILSKRSKMDPDDIEQPIGNWPNAANGTDVLVWSAQCAHDGHGSQYPMVKARGLVPTSALKLVELLLDSNRVKSYNKMSLGRTDEHCFFTKGVDSTDICPTTGIQGELKIVHSKSQPPVIRKPVELHLLLHARRLHSEGEAAKYITIGRSVWETAEGTAKAVDSSATRCEMLLSANMIRELENTSSGEKWCEITTITHAVSPGIPMTLGRRVGLAAAANYVRDIRAVFEKYEV